MVGIWYFVLIFLITFTLKRRLKSKVKLSEREGIWGGICFFCLPTPPPRQLRPARTLRKEPEQEEEGLGKQPAAPGLGHRHLGITESPCHFPMAPPLCAAHRPSWGWTLPPSVGCPSVPSVPGHVKPLGSVTYVSLARGPAHSSAQ